MKKNRKQHLLLAVLLVIVIGVVCGGIRMVQSRKAAESEPAFSLTISGVPISEEEYVQCMKRVRYDTKMELKGQKKTLRRTQSGLRHMRTDRRGMKSWRSGLWNS